MKCPEHGVRQARLPWAEPGSRFTFLFEALVVDVLLPTDMKKAATLLGLTWDEAWHIMERAVVRGRGAKPEAMPAKIGVDEKAIAKGHRYMMLVCDLEQATVEYIGDERRETSLRAYFAAFEPEARETLQAISLDMWPPYINACRQDVPDADQKMVFDRFHIMRHVVDAVYITIDKSGASTASVRGLVANSGLDIELRQSKVLNNLIEQDHRAVKRRVCPMTGSKTFDSARKLIDGIELMHMIKKGQMRCPDGLAVSAADYYCSLASR